jgi:hypothetical protein
MQEVLLIERVKYYFRFGRGSSNRHERGVSIEHIYQKFTKIFRYFIPFSLRFEFLIFRIIIIIRYFSKKFRYFLPFSLRNEFCIFRIIIIILYFSKKFRHSFKEDIGTRIWAEVRSVLFIAVDNYTITFYNIIIMITY